MHGVRNVKNRYQSYVRPKGVTILHGASSRQIVAPTNVVHTHTVLMDFPSDRRINRCDKHTQYKFPYNSNTDQRRNSTYVSVVKDRMRVCDVWGFTLITFA